MSQQNLITINVNPDLVTAISAAIGEVETRCADFISLPPEVRRSAAKMGSKSEAFCRQTLSTLALYPHIVPTSVDLADANQDLAALDQLRPLFERLRHLAQRAADTELALGSDVMATALAGYRGLKAFGRGQGLEPLRRDLGVRFNRAARTAAEPAAS